MDYLSNRTVLQTQLQTLKPDWLMIKVERLRKKCKNSRKKSCQMKNNPNIHWINIEIEGEQYSSKWKWFENRTNGRRKFTASFESEEKKKWQHEIYFRVEKSNIENGLYFYSVYSVQWTYICLGTVNCI